MRSGGTRSSRPPSRLGRGGTYQGGRDALLTGMQTLSAHRPDWRSLTHTEKQRRLAGLRQRQHQQVARDARVLLLVRHD